MNQKNISKAVNPLLPASVAAMQRAAERARRLSLMTHTALVVWRDGGIVRLDPQDLGLASVNLDQEPRSGIDQVAP